MKNLHIVTIILISLAQCLFASEYVLQQSFEEAASDNWAFSVYPATYTGSNPNWSFWTRDDDVVNEMKPLPDTNGSYVWTMENTNFTNTDLHTVTFQTVDLSSYTGSLSLHFSYYTLDYENKVDGSWSGDSDELAYCVEFDNGTSWDNYTELSHGSNEWIEINVTIPSNADYVRLKIAGKNDR